MWEITTDSLAASAWNAICVGLLTVLGVWLVGPGRQAVAARRELAPRLRRAEVAWPIFAVLLVLLLWILPIQDWKNGLIIAVLAIIGFEVLRRQVARETPVAATSPLVAGARERIAGMRDPPGRRRRGRRSSSGSRSLHASGALTDEEFAAAKAELSRRRARRCRSAPWRSASAYEARSRKTPIATSSQPAPLTPWSGPHAST